MRIIFDVFLQKVFRLLQLIHHDFVVVSHEPAGSLVVLTCDHLIVQKTFHRWISQMKVLRSRIAYLPRLLNGAQSVGTRAASSRLILLLLIGLRFVSELRSVLSVVKGVYSNLLFRLNWLLAAWLLRWLLFQQLDRYLSACEDRLSKLAIEFGWLVTGIILLYGCVVLLFHLDV